MKVTTTGLCPRAAYFEAGETQFYRRNRQMVTYTEFAWEQSMPKKPEMRTAIAPSCRWRYQTTGLSSSPPSSSSCSAPSSASTTSPAPIAVSDLIRVAFIDRACIAATQRLGANLAADESSGGAVDVESKQFLRGTAAITSFASNSFHTVSKLMLITSACIAFVDTVSGAGALLQPADFGFPKLQFMMADFVVPEICSVLFSDGQVRY